jgi:bacterioferritin-associated ferredoxin
MYVCICNGLTDRQIRACADSPGCSVEAVYQRLGVRPKCGRCVPMARAIVAGAGGIDRDLDRNLEGQALAAD